MQIRIKYFAQLKSKAGKTSEVLKLESGQDLQECIKTVSERNDGRIDEILFDESGTYRDSVVLVINSRQVRYVENPKMNDGDELMILSPIAGG